MDAVCVLFRVGYGYEKFVIYIFTTLVEFEFIDLKSQYLHF